MFLDLTIIGLAITLEPIPLTAFLVILGSERGTRKGAAFVAGWLVSLSVVVAITVAATGDSPPKPNTEPSLAALAVKIALGVVLLLIALRRYRRLGQPKKPKKQPKWRAGVDKMSPLYAMGVAFLVQPWGLIAAGAASATEAKLSSWESYLTLVYFCLVSCGLYLVTEVYAIVRPAQTKDLLLRLRTWIEGHTDILILWVSLIIGLWLIAKSVYVLAS